MRDGFSLWQPAWIEQYRIDEVPKLTRTIVAIDPPAFVKDEPEPCGIIAAGLAEDGRVVIAADRSILTGHAPNWARATIEACQAFGVETVFSEAQPGGDAIPHVLGLIDPSVSVRQIKIRHGKYMRAEPVAAMYAEGRVVHADRMPALESEMCAFPGADGSRLNALVLAVSGLTIYNRPPASIRAI